MKHGGVMNNLVDGNLVGWAIFRFIQLCFDEAAVRVANVFTLLLIAHPTFSPAGRFLSNDRVNSFDD
jgi:hypothetical protein